VRGFLSKSVTHRGKSDCSALIQLVAQGMNSIGPIGLAGLTDMLNITCGMTEVSLLSFTFVKTKINTRYFRRVASD
jgi:hypothetical protein